jgi:hypothetical protein
MSAAPRPRRNLASQPALTPQGSDTPAPRYLKNGILAAPAPIGYKGSNPTADAELKFLRTLLKQERFRHSTVERALAAHVASLNRQVNDLRGLYFAAIKFPIEGTKK